MSEEFDGSDREEGLLIPEGDDVTQASLECEASSPLMAPAANHPSISYRQHMGAVFRLTYPIIIAEIFQNTLPTMDIIFVGQLGADELGAAALATSWFNLCNLTMVGFMTAIDTLLSQTLGANQHEQYAIWTGNSLIIVFLVTIVLSAVMALCGPAMHLIGQDPDLADGAGAFALRLIPGLFPYYLFKVLTKYLQTQHILAQGVWIGIFANVCNALFNWAFIFKAGWGLAGSPWATTLTRTLELVVIIVYMLLRKNTLKDTWPQFSINYMSFALLKPFWELAISGAAALAACAWAFEVTTMLAGRLGTIQLGAHILTVSIGGIIFLSFSFSTGIAASIRVGKLMGEQRPDEARRSSHMFYSFGVIIQLVLIAILMLCKESLGNFVSADEDVSSVVSQLIPIMCVFLIGDTIQATSSGVLRGLGKQRVILVINICTVWFVGLTSSIILAFVAGLDIYGLWWGMVIGIYSTAIIGIFIMWRVDWKEESKSTMRRIMSSSTGMVSASRHSSRSPMPSSDSDTFDGQEGEADGEYHVLLDHPEEEE